MANYNKSFNFKNGVQVDVDKFIVRGSLVGIGTSIPGETFDVVGNVRVAGLVTATNLNVTGVATFNQVSVGSIQLSASAGVVTATAFYGNGATLSNLPTSQWVDVDVGLGFTSIYAAGNVGVSTVDPRFSLQIGANPLDNLPGVGINSNGNIITTGIISATSFFGAGYGITSLNASNITGGSLPSTVIPQSLFIGVVTATTFYGTLVGIASTALSLSGSPNITVSNITSSNISNSGIITSNLIVSGVSSIGISTVSTRLYAESIGVGTNSPSSDIHIRRTSTSKLQVTSDSADAIVAFGRSTTVTGNNGVLRFGNTSGLYPYSTPSSVDIINYAVGNVNSYLHLGASGLGTGAFNWLYGQNLTNLMTLTYDGKLGIGITTPINSLHVVGTSTVTGNSYVGNSLFVNSNLSVNGSFSFGGVTLGGDGAVNSNFYATTGISTVANLNVYNTTVGVSSIGLGTDKPAVGFDGRNDAAYFSRLGLSTTALFNGATTFAVNGFSQLEGVGIGTTALYDPGFYGQIQIHGTEDFDSSMTIFGSQIDLNEFCSVGFNTYFPRSIFDFGRVGAAATIGYIIPPTLTTVQRTAIVSPVAGGRIYNSNTNTQQYYNGTRWFDVATTDGNSANAGFSTFARWAGISTIASVAGFATFAATSGFSTVATQAGVSTIASVAGFATVSTQAGISTTVSGGIANVTALQVSGVTTFTNGPVRIGTGITLTSGNANFTGVVTATNFIGNGSGLTGIVASGTGIVIKNGGSLVGTASTIDFGTNLSVSPVSAGVVTVTASGGSSGVTTYASSSGIATYATSSGYASTAGISTVAQNLTGSPNITVSSVNSSGVVTASSFSGSNTLKSRTTVTGVTTSITNNGIGNTDITGFKSYALMKVGLSTAGWLRIYTDSTSRVNDVSRSVGIDPAPGSGVIAEVVTTGISTTQIITPFVMGGNLNNPADTTLYAAITNLSGVTTSISVQLTILQLEA